jgi:hypothetical protein
MATISFPNVALEKLILFNFFVVYIRSKIFYFFSRLLGTFDDVVRIVLKTFYQFFERCEVIPKFNDLNSEIQQAVLDGIIDRFKPVEVYRNLHKKCLSVRQAGLVRCHVESVTLQDVQFRVSQSGRRRVIESGRKNVHAVIRGVLPLVELSGIGEQIRYNPYKMVGFTTRENRVVQSAEQSTISREGIFAIDAK